MANADHSYETKVYDDNLRGLLAHMAENYKERLAKMLREKSLSFGPHRLSAGQMSDYYFDCKLTTLDPEGAFLTGHCILELLDELNLNPDAIGGMTMGADPIISATAVISYLEKQRRPLPGFLIRKEPKEHGKGKQVEGFDVSGKRVVIIDEVCTTGGSIFEAIDAVTKQNAQIVGIISLVDREEGGSDELRKRRYNYHSVFTASRLLAEEPKSAGSARRAL